MRILIEAVGCLTSGYLIKSIQKAGHSCIGTDADINSVGKHIVNEFFQVPFATEINYEEALYELAVKKHIDLVLPTLDDGILKWADLRGKLEKKGTIVALSPKKTLEIFLDKWQTYLFFKENGIPTPKSSLKQVYPLVKPREGRGGTGIFIAQTSVDMKGYISQEVLEGTEYTIDVFCDIEGNPIYIVPRVRLGIKDGKSTAGLVVNDAEINDWIKKLCKCIKFVGPINIQCFRTNLNEIKFTEINPRLGGGTALAMAATENWVNLTINTFISGQKVEACEKVKYGLKMGRYYDEIYYF